MDCIAIQPQCISTRAGTRRRQGVQAAGAGRAIAWRACAWGAATRPRG